MNKNEIIKNNEFLKSVVNLNETLWLNTKLKTYNEASKNVNIDIAAIDDAELRLKKFASLIEILFPETKPSHGIIESPLKEIEKMKNKLQNSYNIQISGKLLLKMDSHLAIAGSVKARGGIYEVLKYAESLVIKNNMLTEDDDYSILAEQKYRDFFNQYTIQVGSTGNLGLSIGITSAALGFKVIVHMSSDAKQWKKSLLRSKGATVVEYDSDFSKAVEEGRKLSDMDEMSYFVDDENSRNLFLGYSVAARRLKKQLIDLNVTVDKEHPLIVYLPCGVGGAPGGITYGLKSVYKDNIHCFFVEPTHAPSMLIGMATGLHNEISVQDLGIDGKTHADGLAVGRPSKLVGKIMDYILSGIFTIDDNKLYNNMRLLHETEGIDIEPSSCAAFAGPILLESSKEGIQYIKENNLEDKMTNATHIAWATGGLLVPEEINNQFLSTYL
ncbi:D-serine ammonia-lyase [Sedimentibacter sp. MB31-C6]|uniref:D-serine ammonia-lyase n=1 Tax=Sedimentibacter sp. MB31-C6 TaxID=3109366 RepID=UPI002DDCB2BF|nr:D-serine ammonia-lyase [Sedimentibacter sp. MB36-C1]WSI05616.1 D-serine ammonia-lyase [Sedimentibacter sp. MB36-C1]